MELLFLCHVKDNTVKLLKHVTEAVLPKEYKSSFPSRLTSKNIIYSYSLE